MEPFATVQDMIDLYRPLTGNEAQRAEKLLPVVSDALRQYAKNVGKDLDAMIRAGQVLENTVKSITVDITARALADSDSGSAGSSLLLSQTSQSALGYSVSGTYLNPGGGIFVKNAELKRLGLLRQRLGVIDFVQHD